MSVFDAYGRYYDLLYRDKDYRNEACYVDGLIRARCPGAASLMDLGCGTGAHGEAFVELGYRVRGIDQSHRMLEAAAARAMALPEASRGMLSFAEGDARYYREDGRYDAVVSLFHVMSYQTTDDDLLACFRTAHSHLAPGGLFVFDVWFGPGVAADPPEIRIKRFEDDATRVTRISEPTHDEKRRAIRVDFEVFCEDKSLGQIINFSESHVMRYLHREETEGLLARAGFSEVECFGWMSGVPPAADAWYAVFTALHGH